MCLHDSGSNYILAFPTQPSATSRRLAMSQSHGINISGVSQPIEARRADDGVWYTHAGEMTTPPLHLTNIADKDLIEAQLHCELQTCSCKRINMNHAFRVPGEQLPRCYECAKPIRSHSLVTGERIERVTVLGSPPLDIPRPNITKSWMSQ